MIKNISPNNISANSLKPEDKRDPRMLEAAQSFENQFIRQMISEMRKTVPKDELIGESMGEDIFKAQLDDEYAESWTKNGGIGLTDVIYGQLEEKYGKHTALPVTKGEFIPLPQHDPPTVKIQQPSPIKSSMKNHAVDIFDRGDKSLFVAKKTSNGFDIRSREPLPERVDLHSPLAGVVLQATALEDGRQVILIKHDEGLVSQFIHTGLNHVKSNSRVAAGDVIAQLPPSQKGEGANVVFGLRKTTELE